MRRLLALAALAALAACAPTRAERLAALNRFVGEPEAAIVQAFGVPHRTYETGGIRFLAYDERRLAYAPGYVSVAPIGGVWHHGFGPGWYGYGYAAFPPPMIERLCETTFEVAQGRVRAVSLRGDACGY